MIAPGVVPPEIGMICSAGFLVLTVSGEWWTTSLCRGEEVHNPTRPRVGRKCIPGQRQVRS